MERTAAIPDRSSGDSARRNGDAQRKRLAEAEEAKDASERLDTDYDPVHVNLGRSDPSDVTHERHDVDFRDDFYLNHRTEPGVTYEQYRPAYHYGNDLAWDQKFWGSRDWSEVKQAAQSGWDEDRYGAWERFEASVQFAWDRVHKGDPLSE